MDAKTIGQELANEVRAIVALPDARYELQSELLASGLRFYTAADAVAGLERGVLEGVEKRFVYRERDGSALAFTSVGDQWRREDGKSLGELQEALDREAVSGIEARAAKRAELGADFEADVDLAGADASAFRSIQDPHMRARAAVEVANNARSFPAYKQGLDGASRMLGTHGSVAQDVYELDRANSAKIAAKEDRKEADMAAITQGMRERAAAWNPQEAAEQARRDADALRAEGDELERVFKVRDMAVYAGASSQYKVALQAVAPEVFMDDEADATREAVLKLARDLAEIAAGKSYSEKVIRDSVERLSALQQQPEASRDPALAADRIMEALVACKLALHGVSDVHHKLQDASVVLVLSVEGASPRNDLPATDDPKWLEQIHGLKAVTSSLNAAAAPGVNRADFTAGRLQEFGADVGLQFGGAIEQREDGSKAAWFKREADAGQFFHVALVLPADASQVVAHPALGKEDLDTALVSIEGAALPRSSVIGALDAAAAAYANLQERVQEPESTTQAQAQALAQRVAGELDAVLGDWTPSEAKEWVRTMLTTAEGKSVRVSASTGGVVSLNGNPFTPYPERQLNVTHSTVTTSVKEAIACAYAPTIPIKTDRVFAEVPGALGAAWGAMADAENRLAGYLTALDDGTALVAGDSAWYLERQGDELVLMHADVVDGALAEPVDRFQAGLDWVDLEQAELEEYTARVTALADSFVADHRQLATMRVELNDSPSLSM